MEVEITGICVECHEDKPIYAKEMCNKCYQAQRRAGKTKIVQQEKIEQIAKLTDEQIISMPLAELNSLPFPLHQIDFIMRFRLDRLANVIPQNIEQLKEENANYAKFIRDKGLILEFTAFLAQQSEKPL